MDRHQAVPGVPFDERRLRFRQLRPADAALGDAAAGATGGASGSLTVARRSTCISAPPANPIA